MNQANTNQDENNNSKNEKRHQLFLKQKALLELFMEKRAISKENYEKSLYDMAEKMGESISAIEQE